MDGTEKNPNVESSGEGQIEGVPDADRQDNAGKSNIVVEIPNTGVVPESDTTEDMTVEGSTVNNKETPQDVNMSGLVTTSNEIAEPEKSGNALNENSAEIGKNENMEDDGKNVSNSEPLVPTQQVEMAEDNDDLPNPEPPVPNKDVEITKDIEDLPNPGPPVPTQKVEITEEVEDLPNPGPPVPIQKVEIPEEVEDLPNPGPPVPKSQEIEEDDLPNPGPPLPPSKNLKPEIDSEDDLELVMKNITPFHTDIEQFEVLKNKKKQQGTIETERSVNDTVEPNAETPGDDAKMSNNKNSNIVKESLQEESSNNDQSKQDISASEQQMIETFENNEVKEQDNKKPESQNEIYDNNSKELTSKQENCEFTNDVKPPSSDPTKISVQVPPAGVETPEPGEHQDMKLARSPTKSLRVHYHNAGPEYYHYNDRFMDEDDLGIYDDIGDDGDLSDAEEALQMLSGNDYQGLRGSKVRRSKKLAQGGPKTGDYNMADELGGHVTIVPSPSVSLSDMRHYSGMRGKACTPASRYSVESRNASRINLESREAMFRRAMTLLSARCTSVAPLNNGGPSVEAQFGVSSKGQVIGIKNPEYFYIKQEKPRPMPPLKAWNGYNGNVYFEPIIVSAVKENIDQDEMLLMNGNKSLMARSNDKFHKLLVSRKRTSSERLERPDSGATRSSKNTTRSLGNKSSNSVQRQMALLDKRAMLNRFDSNLQEDLDWLERQETTGSLSIRPKSDVTMDRAKRKEMMYNKERICKGSVVHKVNSDDTKRRPKIPLKVNGGRFVPHNQMSPLLRTQTQYSLSNHRLTTNSPDPYHQALPPLEQLRATVRHMETAEAANKPSYRYNKPVTITEEIKPFVKYSVDVKNKRQVSYV